VEHISKALPKKEDIKMRQHAPSTSESPKEVCLICNGAGVVHPRLQSGDVDFSKTVPCQCKVKELERQKAETLLRNCQLPVETEKMTFDNFKVDATTEEAFGYAKKLAGGSSEVKWLTLTGQVDMGKTHLAVAICREWLKRGVPARFADVPLLLDELRVGYSSDGDNSYQAKIDFFYNVPLLVLDDLGAEKPTGFAKEKLYAIINYRSMNGLPLVVTSNKPLDEIPGDDDHRIASRLRRFDFCRVVGIEGEEYWARKQKKGA
jgi:DNA replication protein DnaC